MSAQDLHEYYMSSDYEGDDNPIRRTALIYQHVLTMSLPFNCCLEYRHTSTRNIFTLKITPTQGCFKDKVFEILFNVYFDYESRAWPQIQCLTKQFHNLPIMCEGKPMVLCRVYHDRGCFGWLVQPITSISEIIQVMADAVEHYEPPQSNCNYICHIDSVTKKTKFYLCEEHIVVPPDSAEETE